MIIMINGPFGSGKTSVAQQLLERIPNSMLYDPEEVGFLVRKIIPDEIKCPEEKTDNFQDIELWRILTVQVAELLTKKYQKDLIIPMTIYRKDYFQYIYTGLKHLDNQTYHFCLQAEESTIYHRLRKRGELEGNWCFQQTKKCVKALKDECFQEFISTDERSVVDVARQIEERIRKQGKM